MSQEPISPATGAVDEEAAELRRCIRDLVALSALPAHWTGHSAAYNVETFADVLISALRLDLVYARLQDPAGGTAVEVVCAGGPASRDGRVREIGAALAPWLTADGASPPPSIPHPVGSGTVQLLVCPIGHEAEGGRVVAGSTRPDFPTDMERLLLSVAANQAAIWLQGARAEAALLERGRLAALSADVATALIQNDTLPDMLRHCAEAMVRHLDAAFARIWTLNREQNRLELQASAGIYTHTDGPHSRVPVGSFKIGLIAQERQPLLTNAVIGDPRIHDQNWARREGLVAFAGYPLVVEDAPVGVMAMFARHPLSEATLQAMASVANGIALGIERLRTEERLREETRTIETINRVGQSLAAELDLHKLVQAATNAATELTGAQFGAFFYNVIGEKGEAYTLYTLSGVPREAFASFPMPRNTAVFGPTFRGEGAVRLDDVTQDPRYGQNPPYHGMPAGHLPVRSYLAVPVVSRSGEVLGGLFFGHAAPGVFTERAERLAAGITAQAAIAIDNAHLYSQAQTALDSMRVARDQAEKASQVKSNFLRMISHELRTPLNSLQLQLQLLQRDHRAPLSPRQQEVVERMSRSSVRLQELVEALLEYARIESGRLTMQIEPLDLGALAGEVVEELRTQAEQKALQLELRPAPELPPLPSDRRMVRLILVNLIGNAVKFTERGSVEVSLTREEGGHQIRIRDTGPGIPPDRQALIFEPFEHLEPTRHKHTAGFGLGLALVKEIVDGLGGQIELSSQPGAGSTFTVTLPSGAP